MFANNQRQARAHGASGDVLGGRRTRRGLIAFVVAFGWAGAAVAAACDPASVELRSGTAISRFNVEVADTDAERALGLMNREKLPMSAGMLFAYESPRRVQFWMKNTLIPLDMVFADSTGLVTRVQPMAKPLDETPIDGGPGVAFVLEINGGLAKRLGIVAGSELRHPLVDQATAVWACSSE